MAKPSKEKSAEYSRRWREKNREKYLELARATAKRFRDANPERHKAFRDNWVANNRESYLAGLKAKRDGLRQAALDAYGPWCHCCGEARVEFLAIDHTNGGGNQHRREIGGSTALYRWLKKNGYPSGFRVLCHNCNHSLGAYGYCPHDKEAADVEG